jgi:cyclin-dependent kinase-like
VVHRDVKPENILISRRGVVKICDFGFARAIAPPGEAYTDYVATRWYRSPELLVGDTNYGRAVDVWAIGCLFAEMLTSEALFQGESDIDQLYMITKCFGSLIARHKEIFSRNPLFIGMRLPEPREIMPIERRYPRLSPAAMDIIKVSCMYTNHLCYYNTIQWSLRLDPSDRPTCTQLLKHELFQRNGWSDKFVMELRTKIMHEIEDNPLVKSLGVTIYGSVYDMQNEITKE